MITLGIGLPIIEGTNYSTFRFYKRIKKQQLIMHKQGRRKHGVKLAG